MSFDPSSFYLYMVRFHFKKHHVKTASQELLEGLQQLSSTTSPGVCFKDGQDWEERLGQVCVPSIFSWIHSKWNSEMLSKVSISALTHGLSLHPQPHTLTLRFPYHEQDYCNMASNHILSRSSTDLREVEQTFSILVSSRADRLLEAADRMRGSRGEVAEGLVRSA